MKVLDIASGADNGPALMRDSGFRSRIGIMLIFLSKQRSISLMGNCESWWW